MSAMNFLVLPDRLHLFGDTAVYSADGVIRAFRSKMTLAKNFAGVIGTTGNVQSGTLVDEALADCGCFDDLVEAAGAVFDRLVEEGHNIAVFAAGFSTARDGFEVWHGGTSDNENQFVRKHTSRDGNYFGGQPKVPPEECTKALAGLPKDNAVVFARAILTLQRMDTDWPGRAPGQHLVGGKGELAIVTRAAAEVCTIIEWPEDRVGELIKPEPVDWDEWRRAHAEQWQPATALAPRMTRHERRAAKAKARKAA